MLSEDEIRKRIASVEAMPKRSNLNQLLNRLVIETFLTVLEEPIDTEERKCRLLLDDLLDRGLQLYDVI